MLILYRFPIHWSKIDAYVKTGIRNSSSVGHFSTNETAQWEAKAKIDLQFFFVLVVLGKNLVDN